MDLGRASTAEIGKGVSKILYVDSYHWEYQWSRRIREGLYGALGVSHDELGLPVGNPETLSLRVIQMDTKRNTSEEFKVAAGRNVRDEIESWKPDLVICSDDNAAKYLIEPYYIGSDIPFVFCGINHDATEYGFPASNVTGMVEMHNAVELVNILKVYASGDRVAYLSGDNLSGRKIGDSVQEQLGFDVNQVYVSSYREWKEQYEALQKVADILLFETAEYFSDWDGNLKALEWFVSNVTAIPTGAWDDSLETLALVTLERMGEEQGEWAGRTALRILSGASDIGDIPVVRSKRAAVYLNMKLAKEQGILFQSDLLDISHLTNQPNTFRKLLYVNSYHRGDVLSDEIEMGLIKAISRSDMALDLKIYRMDTKRNSSEVFGRKQALEVKKLIEEWGPDVVIGSDDSFVRYVIVPYFQEGTLPIVFCGVNWNAMEFGFPPSHITGMVEVAPVRETVEMLSPYSRGDRVGFLGVESFYVQRMIVESEELLERPFDSVRIVTHIDEWERAYRELQEEVDMVILTNPAGLEGYSKIRIVGFIHENTRIPSGITAEEEIEYALLGVSKVAEEQGWWAGSRALDILQGIPVSNIPQTINRETKVVLNLSMADELGIRFSPDILVNASLFSGVSP